MPYIVEGADAAANAGTAYSLAVGDFVQGLVASLGERDWYRIELQAGQTYTFALTSRGGELVHLHDPLLYLRNSAGQLLVPNPVQLPDVSASDDTGPGLFSSITYTATSSGTYYLDIGGYDLDIVSQPNQGTYQLSATTGSRANYDIFMGAAALIQPDQTWSDPGTAASVTWAVRNTFPGSVDAANAAAPFFQLSAAQISAVQTALQNWSEAANITFTQVNPGGTSNNATMLFSSYESVGDNAGAYAIFPGATPQTGSSSNEGDVRFDNLSVSTTSLPSGTYSYFVVLHEIGHAIGLSHPGDYNASPGQNITYAEHAQFIQDTHQYSVMSYFDEGNTSANWGFDRYPQTLMMGDIYAAQVLYGANLSTRNTATTYGYSVSAGLAGSVYDFSTNATPVICIWDGGGLDTIDLSGYGGAQTLNLGQGTFSSVLGLMSNLSIAYQADIENAVGGGGADAVTGNSLGNIIRGMGGNDMLDGREGSDVVVVRGTYGQYDFDEIIGGGYRIIDRTAGRDGVDRVFNFENISFETTGPQLFTMTSLVPTVTFGSPAVAIANFGAAQGWTSDLTTPRRVGDINGDNRADVIGFDANGTWAALSNGGAFGSAFQAVAAFGAAQGWTNADTFPRQIADVNGDGRDDIIGFGASATLVSLGQGGGTFAAPVVALAGFSHALGWNSQDQFTRYVGDINGDGRADIIGFGNAGVLAALGQANGTFSSNYVALANSFNPANGWTSDVIYTRLLGDVNGDGRADIVGFGFPGVLVSLARDDNSGTFLAPYVAVEGYNPANGWISNNTYPRLLADVTGDGRLDIIGFGNSVLVARSLADGTFGTLRSSLNGFNFANGWSSDQAFPREMGDVDGDGRADIIGFGGAGILLALNTGLQFAAKDGPDFPDDAIGWDGAGDTKPVSEFDYA